MAKTFNQIKKQATRLMKSRKESHLHWRFIYYALLGMTRKGALSIRQETLIADEVANIHNQAAARRK